MRRVVVTGMGIVSSIGNNKHEVEESLKTGRSGVVRSEEYAERGFRSQVLGSIKLDIEEVLDRRTRRFMGGAAAYSYLAMLEAIDDAGLTPAEISNDMTGLIVGSGGPSTSAIVSAADIARQRGARRVGVTQVPKAMSSTSSANLATLFPIKGVSYSISSACATSAHCIGNAVELIQLGKQNMMFAGGGDEIDWTFTVLFDAMGALSSNYNDSPTLASRPFDAQRDGFVISGGGGILVLEELEHAKARSAKIYGEVVGYGATSDGVDMVAPSGEGAQRCLKMALRKLDCPVNYVNAHATSTIIGDAQELRALKQIFNENLPYISSTKSLTGHSQGAAGVHEAIYSLLMMQHNFICASSNLDTIDPETQSTKIVTQTLFDIELDCVLSNSFGFGGTNACLVFRRLDI
ncbi:MAG: beta-ketoacyl-ACP synthase I [Gammaproteobacteria bacterium]|nr:beta-ketoacyl-ACP synthase I [Gammaproteobacteria bacterium]